MGSLHCHQGELFWTLNDQYCQGFCVFVLLLFFICICDFKGNIPDTDCLLSQAETKGKGARTKSGAQPAVKLTPAVIRPQTTAAAAPMANLKVSSYFEISHLN